MVEAGRPAKEELRQDARRALDDECQTLCGGLAARARAGSLSQGDSRKGRRRDLRPGGTRRAQGLEGRRRKNLQRPLGEAAERGGSDEVLHAGVGMWSLPGGRWQADVARGGERGGQEGGGRLGVSDQEGEKGEEDGRESGFGKGDAAQDGCTALLAGCCCLTEIF